MSYVSGASGGGGGGYLENVILSNGTFVLSMGSILQDLFNLINQELKGLAIVTSKICLNNKSLLSKLP